MVTDGYQVRWSKYVILESNNSHTYYHLTIKLQRWHWRGPWYVVRISRTTINLRGKVNNTELVFRASEELEQYGKFSRKLLQSVQGASSLDGNPIYALLHEAIYCQGWILYITTALYSVIIIRLSSVDKLQIGVQLVLSTMINASHGLM